jgi:formyl-CoA transferase
VLDLSDELSTYGAKLLGLLGAEVVRVEPPAGSSTRRRPPLANGVSAFHEFMETGKRSVAIDLETDEGRASFEELLATCDVVYESLPVGKLAALGLGWERIRELSPKTVLVSVTSFGQTGPYAAWRTGEVGLWALSGTLPTTGYPDRRPIVAPSVAGILVGTIGAVAALAALRARTFLGHGQWVDVSAHETLVAAGNAMLPQIDDLAPRRRAGAQGASVGPWGYFPCADRMVSVLAVAERHWRSLAEWIHEETGDDVVLDEAYAASAGVRYRERDTIDRSIGLLTRRYGAAAFCAEAQRRGLAAMPLNSVADLLTDPHLEEAGFWQTSPDGTPVRWPGPPFEFRPA